MSDAGYRMLGAGAWGWSREMIWGGRWEGDSGLGACIYLWWIHVNVWQNQYSIVKWKNKNKKKFLKKKSFYIVVQTAMHRTHFIFTTWNSVPTTTPLSLFPPSLGNHHSTFSPCGSDHFRHLTLVLFPGKSHGQRSLVGYSPWGR